MTSAERHPRDVLASVERRTLDALAGIDGLLDPSGGVAFGDAPRSGLRMIVAERQVRELARGAQQDILGALAEGGLGADELGLAAALLHTSQVVGRMCDEYVDLNLLGEVSETESDDRVTRALSLMRDLCRRQVHLAAAAFATPRDEIADSLRSGQVQIEALNTEVTERALVGEDGAVRREALCSAVIAAECLTLISERAVDIGEYVRRLISGPSTAGSQSPVSATTRPDLTASTSAL